MSTGFQSLFSRNNRDSSRHNGQSESQIDAEKDAASIEAIGGGVFVSEVIGEKSLRSLRKAIIMTINPYRSRRIADALFKDPEGIGSRILGFPVEDCFSCMGPILEKYGVDSETFSTRLKEIEGAHELARQSIYAAEASHPNATRNQGKDCYEKALNFVRLFREILPYELHVSLVERHRNRTSA